MNDYKTKNKGTMLKPITLSGIISFALILLSPYTFADSGTASIKSAKITQQDNQATLHISLSKPVKYKAFTLPSPDRVVIDLNNTHGNIKLNGNQSADVTKLRHSIRNTDDLRIVLDLKNSAKISTSLKNNKLAIKLMFSKKASTQSKKKVPVKGKQPTNTPVAPRYSHSGMLVIAIDAGHGGRDPGAIGTHGTREKDIVLQIAKKLKTQINRAPGMKAILVRKGDYYIPLRERMQIARKQNADMFISIHADANPSRSLTGSSVYILSQNGASSEAARWLASSENAYEKKLAGTNFHNKGYELATMLMDLSQAATIDNSYNLARHTLSELKGVNRLLHKNVESAAFVVLKSPDIPSMLIETAFISNPAEEQRLKTASYQKKLANAMFKAVRHYQVTHVPGGQMKMQYASSGSGRSQHVVRSGESLSVIANNYGISTQALKRHNKLNSTSIRIGQKLTIPVRS